MRFLMSSEDSKKYLCKSTCDQIVRVLQIPLPSLGYPELECMLVVYDGKFRLVG